jgi:glucose-1-phosphate thymidylyltransferase
MKSTKKYKGIVLAGGTGTRLHPITKGTSKQLLPVYDKPLIYYPISTLMLAGIKDILIITTPEDRKNFISLLGDGSEFGVNLKYKVQPRAEGIAQAFIIGAEFIGNDSVALVLGDNIFYGDGFIDKLRAVKEKNRGATIFANQVSDPERFGVVEFGSDKRVLSLEEKPTRPKSKYAVTGLYFYENSVIDIARNVTPSQRGELEITDVNRFYLKKKNLSVEVLGRGFAWLDCGTHDSLLEAGQFVQTVEKRQGLKIACLEEIAFMNGWLSEEAITGLYPMPQKNEYGRYLNKVITE